MTKRIIILGGYGNSGIIIARLLLAHSDVRITLAGRDEAEAQRTAAILNIERATDRVSAARIDASDRGSLLQGLKDATLVIVASGTIAYTRTVAEAALDAGLDYFDIQISAKAKHAALASLLERIQRSGRCFITDGGFRPGIPGAMVRYAATRIPRLESAAVGSVFQVDWSDRTFSRSSAEEFVDELETPVSTPPASAGRSTIWSSRRRSSW